MAEPRDPEQVKAETIAASEEFAAVATIDDLRAWWKKHYLKLGHKRLARLAILGWPLERIVADKSRGD